MLLWRQAKLDGTFVLFLTSQCWDKELRSKLRDKLNSELTRPGSIVIDYVETTLGSSECFRSTHYPPLSLYAPCLCFVDRIGDGLVMLGSRLEAEVPGEVSWNKSNMFRIYQRI